MFIFQLIWNVALLTCVTDMFSVMFLFQLPPVLVDLLDKAQVSFCFQSENQVI